MSQKITFGNILVEVRGRFNKGKNVLSYERHSFLNGFKLYEHLDKDFILANGDILEFVEYWLDENSVWHRNEFQYNVKY